MGFSSSSNWRSGYIWPSIQRDYPVTVTGNYECSHTQDIFLRCNGTTVSCDPGRFRIPIPGSPGHWNCSQCPRHKFKSHEGPESFCLNCPSNAVSSYDRTYCLCPTGTFWKEPNCLKCPSTASSVLGSKYCNCSAGSFWEEKTCKSCPVGTSSPDGALKCRKCPIGSEVFDEGRSCSCPAGKVWKGEVQTWSSCQNCPANTYKSDEMSTCVPCPPTTTSLEGANTCLATSLKSATVWLGILGSTTGIVITICIVLAWFLYREKRALKKETEQRSPTTVVTFNTTAEEIAPYEEGEEKKEEGRPKLGWAKEVGEDSHSNEYIAPTEHKS